MKVARACGGTPAPGPDTRGTHRTGARAGGVSCPGRPWVSWSDGGDAVLPGVPGGVAAIEFDDVVPGAAQGAGGYGVPDAGLAVGHDGSTDRQLVEVPHDAAAAELVRARDVP